MKCSRICSGWNNLIIVNVSDVRPNHLEAPNPQEVQQEAPALPKDISRPFMVLKKWKKWIHLFSFMKSCVLSLDFQRPLGHLSHCPEQIQKQFQPLHAVVWAPRPHPHPPHPRIEALRRVFGAKVQWGHCRFSILLPVHFVYVHPFKENCLQNHSKNIMFTC